VCTCTHTHTPHTHAHTPHTHTHHTHTHTTHIHHTHTCVHVHTHTHHTHMHTHHTHTYTSHTHKHSNLILNTCFFHTLGNKQENKESKVNARAHDNIAKLYINSNLRIIIKLSG